MPQRSYCISPSHRTKATTIDPDAHGQSPVQRTVMKYGTCAPLDQAKPASTCPHEPVDSPAQGTRELHDDFEDPCWARMPHLPDPFIDDSRYQLHKRLTEGSTSDRQPVSDSHITVPAHDGDSNQIITFGAAQDISPLPESQFDELMASYSPRKDTSSGRFSSTSLKVDCATNTPPRLTVGSELKTRSYSDENFRPTGTATDSELAEFRMDPGSNEGPNVSDRSFRQSERLGTTKRKSSSKDNNSKESVLKSDYKIREQPAGSLRDHDKEIEMREAEDPGAVGGSRRNRANPNSKRRQVNISDSHCSPTRKTSRIGWSGGLDECAGGAMRVRLGSLDNIGRW